MIPLFRLESVNKLGCVVIELLQNICMMSVKSSLTSTFWHPFGGTFGTISSDVCCHFLNMGIDNVIPGILQILCIQLDSICIPSSKRFKALVDFLKYSMTVLVLKSGIKTRLNDLTLNLTPENRL